MPTYSTPGVYVTESTLSSIVPVTAGGTSAVFYGTAERGPEEATLVTDWSTFKRLYGDLTDAHDLGYSVYHFFSNGGRSCYVVRVVGTYTGSTANSVTPDKADTGLTGVQYYPYGSTAASVGMASYAIDSAVATITTATAHGILVGDVVTVASSGTVTAIDGEKTVLSVPSSTTFTFAATGETNDSGSDSGTVGISTTSAVRLKALFDATAISNGTWGNTLTVQIEALGATTIGGTSIDEGGTTVSGLQPTTDTAYGTFTVVVKLGGVEVERWPAVSLDPDSSRYVQTIINTYSKYITVDNVSTTAPRAAIEYITTAFALSGGLEGTVGPQDYEDRVAAIDSISGTLILNAVGQTSSGVIDALVAKASSRGDSFVVIDPDKTSASLSDLQSVASTFAGISGYAAHYAPALKMVDPAKSGPGAIRVTYPGGAIAGLIVRTEVQRSVAKAPAGYAADIRGALGTAINLTDAEIGTLYDGNPYVNSFKVVPGGGVVVYGARTLARTTSDRFVPVRRTLNYIKHSLKQLTEFAVFEPNDENLWARINLVATGFLSEFYRSGGLKGINPSQAFYVVCDSTNNTPTSIDQGIVNVEVGVSLQYPAEFIVINLSQWSGGSNTVESL